MINKNPEKLINELRVKFNSNFDDWSKVNHDELVNIFLLTRVISETGLILKQRAISKHHKKCCLIFDEIFSDVITAIYLASCSLDKPASIVLRRVIELGVTSIYLWDMPNVSYSWELYNQNLSFTDMLNHINSDGYLSYVSEEIGQVVNGELISTTILKRIYKELSDIVHGKITTFETSLEKCFSFSEEDWRTISTQTYEILTTLVNAYIMRFNLKKELKKKIPAFANLSKV